MRNPHPLQDLIRQRVSGDSVGIYSACTAHPLAIEAVIESARDSDTYALIEATANQVDQFGGYTGMVPAQFAEFVRAKAREAGLEEQRLVLGGDHLGPLVWSDRKEAEAMALAEELVRAYVDAGFTKIHIDTTMKLADDPADEPLSDEVIAKRAARLVAACEGAYQALVARSASVDGEPVPLAPVYVIGSEVPIPGGAFDNEEFLSVTTPEHFEQTYRAFQEQFTSLGLDDTLERIVAVVVQPGVEFSDATVTAYDRKAAADLTAQLGKHKSIVFEGHSTDYQTREHLKQMVEDGVAILKVGPALTFALREALFALSCIEDELVAEDFTHTYLASNFKDVLLSTMRGDPTHWKNHYHGTDDEIEEKLKYSLSDRCRYYLADVEVADAIDTLVKNVDSIGVVLPLLHHYMPAQYRRVCNDELPMSATALIKDHIKDRIADYIYATSL